MPPERFGGGGVTYVHPAVAGGMLLIGLLILFLPRRHVVVPLFAAWLLIPMDQVVAVGPFNFQMFRVVILLCWLKILLLKLSSRFPLLNDGMNAIDKVVILQALFSAINTVLLWQNQAALINQMGLLYSTFGAYFLLRVLIREEQDIDRTLRALAYIAVVIAVVMVMEQIKGWSPYALIGGPRQAVRASLMEREGGFRAMAAFGHPILAGTFGGIMLPLFFGLWRKGKGNRVAGLIGLLAATLITEASVSSTPLLAYVAGVFALCLWPCRKMMRLFRWGISLTLISLHMVMKAPVWALIERVDFTGGSAAYHREFLVDNFIRRFSEWWLIGTKSTAHWGWMMWDLANQYVATGATFGLLPFVFFIATIVYGFKYVGIARKASEGNNEKEKFVWAVSAALFANVVAFFGIAYWDQTIAAWYALLAMIWVVAGPAVIQNAQAQKLKRAAPLPGSSKPA